MTSVGDSGSSAGTNLIEKSARSGERGVAVTRKPLTGSPSFSLISEIYLRAFSVIMMEGAVGDDLPFSEFTGVCSQTVDSEQGGQVGLKVGIRCVVVDSSVFLVRLLADCIHCAFAAAIFIKTKSVSDTIGLVSRVNAPP